MPRTAGRGGRRRNPILTPLDRYQALQHHEKVILWKYWQFISSGGTEGWNIAEVGSVFHYRSSAYIQRQGTASWFRHKAQSMVTLAQLFAEQNQAPPELLQFTQPDGQDPQPLPPAAADNMVPPAAAPRTPRAPVRNDNPPPPATQQGMTVPTSFGLYPKFDYTRRVMEPTMLVRMILHNGVEPQDIQFEWINARRLQLRTAWPEWFQNAEQMAAFTLDDEGEPLFPPHHALTMDTSARNQLLVEEDNRIWDTGFLDFEQDMKTDNPEFELLSVVLPNRIRTTVNVLQAYVQ
jgi:hypothetical protein